MDGQLDAITRNDNQREVTLSSLAAGAVMGEMSWLEQRPAVADIVSRGESRLLNRCSPASKIWNGLTRNSPAQLHRLLAQKLALQIQHQNFQLASEPLNPVEPCAKF